MTLDLTTPDDSGKPNEPTLDPDINSDLFRNMERALESENGIKITLPTSGKATSYRQQLYRLRRRLIDKGFVSLEKLTVEKDGNVLRLYKMEINVEEL